MQTHNSRQNFKLGLVYNLSSFPFPVSAQGPPVRRVDHTSPLSSLAFDRPSPLPPLDDVSSLDVWREGHQVKGCDWAGSRCFRSPSRSARGLSRCAPRRQSLTLLQRPLHSSSLPLSFGTWGSTLQLDLPAERILISLPRSPARDPRRPRVSSLHTWWNTSGSREPSSHPFHRPVGTARKPPWAALSCFCLQSPAFLSHYLTRKGTTVHSRL